MRLFLTRRWIVFALVVVALAWLAWRLGEWQFDRLEDRQARNAQIQRNESLDPAPVDDVLAVGRAVAPEDEWRLVTATGTYDPDDTVIVRYRTREGASGVDVVVPLQLPGGPSVLVDRGWFGTDNRGATSEDVPSPPAGEVTVTGWVRQDAEGDSTEVSDQSTRAVDSERIGAALDREVLGGFVDLRDEDPAPAQSLEPVELPELNNGPHFFYGLQWWFFGVLAVVGFCYLALDEWRVATGRRPPPAERRRRTRDERGPGQRARSMPPSTGTMAPDTNDDAGESRNAATRPNSSGSP